MFFLLTVTFFSCSPESPTKPEPIKTQPVHYDNVYVGGGFEYAGSLIVNNIAMWDGKNWHALGTGITGYKPYIGCMAVYKGELYVGGSIDSAGGVPANNIAKWNGKEWSAVGAGINGTVSDLVVYKDELYTSGWYSSAGGKKADNIARWNGSEWLPVGDGFNDEVYTLAIYNGYLYAGGWFTKDNHDSTIFSASKIAKWDGEKWYQVVQKISNKLNSSWVYNLTVFNNKLIAVGNFITVNGLAFNGVTQWNDTTWSPLGSGIADKYKLVYTAIEYNGELNIAGEIYTVGSVYSPYFARWNGKEWLPSQFNLDGSPYKLFYLNDNLYIGGDFKNADNVLVNGVFEWDGNKISQLGSGVKGWVKAMGEYK